MSAMSGTELRKDAVGVSHIVFFVVAAAAPLTAVVGASPAAFAFGNGPGVPGTYLIVGLLYVIFSVGFTAMNRFIASAGGFYAYISNGLGKAAGVASAFITLATYLAIELAVMGLFGFFTNAIVVSAGGPEIHWFVYAALLMAVVYVCGARNIEFSGKVLGWCMIAEIAVLGLLGVAVLIGGGGPQGVSVAPFGPSAIFSSGFGVALVFVVASFIGFEATAIFGEEARDPKRTIARATYLAVGIIAVFYAFATWTVSLHYGPSNIAQQAADNSATLYLTAVKARLGGFAGIVMNALLITSLFACTLSFHNTINRYLFALGREGVAYGHFSRTHEKHQSPYVAGLVQTAVLFVLTLLFAIAGAAPYEVVFAWMSTFASVGILAVQILVSVAVIAFFRKDSRGVGLWPALIAPALGAAGLFACLVVMIANLSLVSGSESLVVDAMPAIIVAIGIAGYLFAVWIRRTRPAVYENLGRAFG